MPTSIEVGIFVYKFDLSVVDVGQPNSTRQEHTQNIVMVYLSY